MEGHTAAPNMGAGRVLRKLRRRCRAQPSAGSRAFLSSSALCCGSCASALSCPSCVLRKGQWRSPACGSSPCRPCRSSACPSCGDQERVSHPCRHCGDIWPWILHSKSRHATCVASGGCRRVALATSAYNGIGRLTEVGRGAQEACPAVEQDGLYRTGATGHGRPHFHVVAAAAQVVERGRRQAILDVQAAGQVGVGREGVGEAEGCEPRLLDRLLEV